MSLLNFHMENHGADTPEGTLITEGDEGQSVAAVLQEATLEERGFQEAEAEAADLDEGVDTVGDTIDGIEESMKTESAGLDPTGAILLKHLMTNVVGKTHTNNRISARMESHAGRATRREATSFTMEGIRDTLKALWEKVKAAFTKSMNRIRSWTIKNFSAAKRIVDQAEKIRDRADNLNTSIENKTFQFAQVARLAVNGKLRSFNEFEAAITALNALGAETVKAQSNSQLDTAIEDLSAVKPADAPESAPRIPLPDLGTGGVALDTRVSERFGEGKTLVTSKLLPGDVVAVTVDTADTNATNFRVARFDIVEPKHNQRKVEGAQDAVTLSASEINKVCEFVVAGGGNILDFEKTFANRERFLKERLRKIDDSVKDDIDTAKDAEDKDPDASAAVAEREIIATARDVTNCIKRMEGIAPKVISVQMGVYAAALNWCEGSMRNYKSA